MKNKILLLLLLLAGFNLQAQFTIVSGGTGSACAGTISIGNYTPGQLYTYTLCTDNMATSQLALEVTNHTLPTGQLCVYNGNSTAAPQIGCSNWGGSSQWITSSLGNTSGCLTFTWQCNNAGETFSANIHCNFICQPFQIDVTTSPAYTTENGTHYVDICQGESINFTAAGVFPGSTYPQSNAQTTFNWDFDYGAVQSGLALTNTSHTFVDDMGYDISLIGVDQYNCNSTNDINLRVRVSQSPSFVNTLATPNSVCTEVPVDLSTFIDTLKWTNEPNNVVAGTTYLPDGSGVSYSTSVLMNVFDPGATLTDVNDLTGICVNMEHSFIGDLVMEITCPNGTTVMLENQGGGGTYLGVPIDDDLPTPGVGWDYCWSPTPQFGIMNVEAASNTTLPSGSYASYQSLSGLLGCPLNGQWTYTVTDNWSIDNGYIFSWWITFNPLLYPDVWSYNNVMTNYTWSAPAATGTYDITNGANGSGQIVFHTTGAPGTTVQEPVMLRVTDDFGCDYDTTIMISVYQTEPLTITGLSNSYCITDSPDILTGYPANGTFTGTGIVAPDSFDPAIAGVGTHTITYAYTYVGTSTYTGLVDVFTDDFSTDKGWTGYGSGGWARGFAMPSTGCSGAQDPSQDHSPSADNFLLGTYIGACYPNSLASTFWVTSPTINCTGMTGCNLDFWSLSGAESNTFDHLYVDVYNGSAWVNVFSNATSGSESVWTLRTFPTPQADNNANFKVRYGIGTTDGSVSYQGWNIDDVLVKCNGTLTQSDTLCDFTTTQDVTVAAQPTSDFTVVTPICINSTTTITYTGNAPPGSTFTWDFSGGTIISGSGAGPYVVQWNAAADYNISLIVINNGCASVQTNNTVSVLSFGDPFCCVMPQPNAGADDNICGLTYTLNAIPSLPAGTWTCVQAGVTINSPNNPISVVTVPANGTYDFVWYEIYGTDCDSTDTVSITFTQQPIANAGNDFDICSHTNTLGAIPSVGVGTWTCTNPLVTFTPATSPTATVTVPSDGQYVFTWTEDNTNGCISSDFITVNFAEQPVANAGSDNAVCLLNYSLQATPSVGTGTWTSSGPGSAIFQNSHSPITQVSVSITGTYTFTWTEDNGLGCTATDDVVIQLTQIPTSTFTTTDIACFGNSSTITYTGTGNSQCAYTWDFNGGTASPGTGMGPHSVTWATANTYNISLQVSLNGCMSTTTTLQETMPELLTATITGIDLPCFGIPTGQVLLEVDGGTTSSSGGYFYIWNNGYLSEDLTNMPEGYYAVTVTDDNGCSLTRGITIVQPPQLSLIVTPSQIICPGTSAPLTIYPVGGTYPYNYFWSGAQSGVTITVNPVANTTYSAYVTDANGCQSQNVSTTVSIHPPLELTAYANTDSICPSEPIIIYYNVSEGSGTPYTVIGSDGVHMSNPYQYFPSTSGSFIVTANDGCGQIATAEIPLHVYPLPPNAFLADTVRGCQPFTVNFIEISPDSGQSYIWDFGDNTNLSLDKTPIHTYNIPGSFDITLTVTSKDNCKTVNVVDDFITVYPRPNAMFTYYPSVVSILKPIVSFTNLSEWGYNYMWSFGSGDSTSEMNPIFRFPDVGEYPVTLITITEFGCRDTSAVSIQVNDEVTFYAPSAFSPDNDQINDLFYVTGHGIDPTKFKMVVFDRWGQELFVTDKYDPNNPAIYGWNGKDKSGKPVRSGTYTWLVVFDDFRYSKHEYAGTVTVIW